MSRVRNKSNTDSAISRRTGLSKAEIQRMRREAYRETIEGRSTERDLGVIRNQAITPPKKGLDPYNLGKTPRSSPTNPVLKRLPISVEVDDKGVKKLGINFGVGQVSTGREGTGASIGGVGFKVDDKGGGSISLPGGIKITFRKEGCFTTEVKTIFGQYAGSNITKDPNCNDDDDDSGNDEPKPPHCIGSDGKPGTGEPKNLLPECTNDGESHLYFIAFNFYEEQEYIYPDYPDRNFTRSRETRQRFLNEATFENKLIQNQTGTPEQVQTEIYPVAAYLESFTGTYTQLQEYLGNRRIMGQYGQIASKLPEGKSDESTRIGWLDWFLTTITVKQKSWAYAWVISPGSGCNPTGNEGCDTDTSTGDNKNRGKNNSPRRGKPSSKIDDSDTDSGDDDMSKCCEETRELLLLLLDHVGYNLSPLEVPSSLTDDDNAEPTIIPNIPSFLVWWFGRWDEVTGKFPQTIKIEDANPTESGNQPATITLSNQAESFAELCAQILTVTQQQQVVLEIVLKTLLTTGLNREQGVRLECQSEAIIDYLGFGTKEVEKKVKQLFNAEKESEDWAEVLEESKSTTIAVEIDDKANLQFSLAELQQAASIIRARYFKKVNPNGGTNNLLEDLTGSLNLLEKMRTLSSQNDWESFIQWIKTQNPDADITDDTLTGAN